MISKIKIYKVASYKEPVEIDDIKKFNFFYGLNGTGKTTLSNYLSAELEESIYSKCDIWPKNVKESHQIFVYNQNYIDQIFRRNPKQPGIFSLGEKDVEAEDNIEVAQAKKKNYEQELDCL